MAWKNKGIWNNGDILNYYKRTVGAYRVWGKDMHYGYWEKGDILKKGIGAQWIATRRMNEKTVEKLNITKDSYVLDVGCGIGGNVVWLAQTFGCKVVGITIVPHQVETGKKLAKEAGVEHLCDFRIMDFMNLEFANETFDVVMGLESICYADPKSEFIKGVYRVLKKDGRFGMADGIASKEEYFGNDKRLMGRWLDGWKVNNLNTPEQWKKDAEAAGFTRTDYVNVTKHAIFSGKIMFVLSLIALPFHILEKFIEIPDYPTDAMFHQYLAMKKGLWEYGIFWAFKE